MAAAKSYRMGIFGALVVALVLCTGLPAQDRELNEVADKLGQQIAKTGKRTIAVLSFTNSQGFSSAFGDYLADQLGVLLVRGGHSFKVVTRRRLNEIMKERSLKYTEVFDKDTYERLGKLSGAETLLLGSYRAGSSVINLTLQVVDTSDGGVIGGEIINIPKTKDIESWLGSADPQQPESPTRDPQDSKVEALAALGSFRQGIDTALLHRCEKRGERFVCFFTMSRTVDRTSNARAQFYFPHATLVDNFNVNHPKAEAYFINGRDQRQEMVTLSTGIPVQFVMEFSGASADISSARIANNNEQVRGIRFK